LTIPRITRLREKFIALAQYGATNVVLLPFNQSLANLSAGDFLNMLCQTLHPVQFVVGDDFRFGQGRQGDFAFIQQAGKTLGYEAVAMDTFLIDGERVSSTRVRKALVAGQLDLAAKLLGRPYTMRGRVSHGDKLGAKLGFPTANIHLHRKLTPVSGIFTVRMHGINGCAKSVPGVANVGTRPTVGGTRTLLEVHLLDFNESIYGQQVEVEFCQKLREEERYDSLAELQAQIAKDVLTAKEYFTQHNK
jgi:riboflavin kinase/FMN adenylyltransferase